MPLSKTEKQRLAEAVRAACLEAASKAYEQASISGLCGEGAWEAARGALQSLDLEYLLRKYEKK
ncbi:MAG: acetyltransferase [Pseudomonadota bacterium]|jgi:hypothetical protein